MGSTRCRRRHLRPTPPAAELEHAARRSVSDELREDRAAGPKARAGTVLRVKEVTPVAVHPPSPPFSQHGYGIGHEN